MRSGLPSSAVRALVSAGNNTRKRDVPYATGSVGGLTRRFSSSGTMVRRSKVWENWPSQTTEICVPTWRKRVSSIENAPSSPFPDDGDDEHSQSHRAKRKQDTRYPEPEHFVCRDLL